MSTPNKYHGSGRIYTAREYSNRKHAMQPTYLITNGRKAKDQPHDVGRNAAKRLARKFGYKSLKQLDRSAG